jgi:hypothetical protein
MITRFRPFLMITLLCVAGASAQSRRPSQAPRRLRTAEDIWDDQAKGKSPQDAKIIMDGIVINNVFKTAKRSADERYLGYTISDEIEYSAGGGSARFYITAHGNDSALLMAERRFIRLLGITRVDACRLDVWEYVIPQGGESHQIRSSLSNCSQNKRRKNQK